ncbi:acetyl-CoA carboxylase biotin carboxylase subunit [Peptostreptococcus stomatis]|uniref:acetyl-CoA carboxylase biotin carboxylase subunit n=1 Tax=Peptostreptococcus stomatis TaxID=341694 RepID=UPI0028D4BAE3|nr:acetyl-CoA carboxylase biotin carboxylase subunit [Peptostreptococcus stomatis]
MSRPKERELDVDRSFKPAREGLRPIKKVLVANRGEIAVRIIRTLKDMGIKSVAIFSNADKDSLHATIADEAICIGPASVKDSYLNKIQIINAALVTGADAIHPGFGFLSENPGFARMCEVYNIKFIGPTSRVMAMMGDKEVSKRMMKEAGVPVVEGSDGVVENLEEAKEVLERLGLPLIIKARSGGGGKGMRLVEDMDDLKRQFDSARKEAQNAFGDPGVYIEKFIRSPRHIEVQLMADEHGNVIHLGARDCSLQMNHQKVIEEAPPEGVDQAILNQLYDTSIRAAKSVSYTSVGTIEYLLDQDGSYYFMEMNTRIQVEHPITEMITGIDIVRDQVLIACGERLAYKQEDILIRGHAIECRINAYDSDNNFLPSVGKIQALNMPGGYGVRVDSAIYQGYQVLPFYDSMLAKVISYGKNRAEAIKIMNRALEEFVVEGVKTNIGFNLKLINDPVFIENKYDTSYLERSIDDTRSL